MPIQKNPWFSKLPMDFKMQLLTVLAFVELKAIVPRLKIVPDVSETDESNPFNEVTQNLPLLLKFPSIVVSKLLTMEKYTLGQISRSSITKLGGEISTVFSVIMRLLANERQVATISHLKKDKPFIQVCECGGTKCLSVAIYGQPFHDESLSHLIQLVGSSRCSIKRVADLQSHKVTPFLCVTKGRCSHLFCSGKITYLTCSSAAFVCALDPYTVASVVNGVAPLLPRTKECATQ